MGMHREIKMSRRTMMRHLFPSHLLCGFLRLLTENLDWANPWMDLFVLGTVCDRLLPGWHGPFNFPLHAATQRWVMGSSSW
jgi:hypothetical protein